MRALDLFSPDYETARARFRAEMAGRGAAQQAHAINATGIAHPELTIDVARIGPADARSLAIISSGLHGVEGFFGSAVQLAWLHCLPRSWQPPDDCAVLFLHALNPYGFAFIRRANEVNIDLNRNFLDREAFSRMRQLTRPDFSRIDRYLDPPCAPSMIDWFALTFAWMGLRFGVRYLRRVMPVGQYAFPQGIFYGGADHGASTRIVMSEVAGWVGAARTVIHLDFHSGLGKFGKYQLLASTPSNPTQIKRARHFFGDPQVCFDFETHDGYRASGDVGEWLGHRFADRDYLYLCAEFGTYSAGRVIGALRRENQAHHWGQPESRIFKACKKEMLEVFAPASRHWRENVVASSLDLIHSAIKYCADSGRSNSK